MAGFRKKINEVGPNLEKRMEIIVEHSKMRKDGSVLRKSGKTSPDRQLFSGCFKNAQGCLNKKLRAFEK